MYAKYVCGDPRLPKIHFLMSPYGSSITEAVLRSLLRLDDHPVVEAGCTPEGATKKWAPMWTLESTQWGWKGAERTEWPVLIGAGAAAENLCALLLHPSYWEAGD